MTGETTSSDDREAPPVLMIAGPTASGKTARAIEHALRVGGEVVSADSRQVFAGMSVCTAAPTAEEMRGVPHHFVGERDVAEGAYSAGAFARDAEARIDEIHARGAVPIVAGGTGFYLSALLRGLSPIPDVPDDVRDSVGAELRGSGLPDLVAELRRVDPDLAATLDLANPARVVRGVEVFRATGTPLSVWQRAPRVRPRHRYAPEVIDVDRAALRARIDARVAHMSDAGLYDEITGLLARGLSPALTPLRTIGCVEVIDHITRGGTGSGPEWPSVLADIATHTHQYARRQRTMLPKIFSLQ